MRTRLSAQTTDELNRKVGLSGEFAIDLERKALRVYDGSLGGGYEVLGEVPPIIPPGPQTLMAGDLETGFYGEVGPEEFIDYGELSSLVGLSVGTLYNQARSLWLKFSMDNHPCYVAKQSIRHSISHDQLIGANLVYGERSVEIDGIIYVVRLLTGLDDSGTLTAGGEWNRLLYPIASSTDSLGWGVNIPDADLNQSGSGRRPWVQETDPSDATRRVYRGISSVGSLNAPTYSLARAAYGWRPILVPQL